MNQALQSTAHRRCSRASPRRHSDEGLSSGHDRLVLAVRLLLFSDLHLDAAFTGLGPDASRKRRHALRDTLEAIAALCADRKVDALLCGGDLYEYERVSPDTASFLRGTFAELHPLPIYIAPGNHDWMGRASVYAQQDWTINVHVFSTDRLEPVELAEGLTLWGGAHCAPANTDDFFTNFQVERGGVNIAIAHASEQGWFSQEQEGKAPHAPFSADEIAASGLDHALLGHIHRPRAAASFTYPGNPNPLSFGEEGERGAVLCEVGSGGQVEREWIRVARSQVHDVPIDISGCSSGQEVRQLVVDRLSGLEGCIRVTLSGEIAADAEIDVESIRDAAQGLDALVVRIADVRAAYDLKVISEEQTVRGQYVREVLEADLDDDARRRVLDTGLRALSGRNDLEVL